MTILTDEIHSAWSNPSFADPAMLGLIIKCKTMQRCANFHEVHLVVSTPYQSPSCLHLQDRPDFHPLPAANNIAEMPHFALLMMLKS